MDNQTVDDRSAELANKTPMENNYMRVHIDIDLQISQKQVSTAIWKKARNVGKQIVIWLLPGLMFVNTPDPQYPQLPVRPDSIEQIQ
ncbi:hypothetical protein [Chamaesiphon sp. OTE_75_metabat_556]|uniref:hypothetical protein n=1 Tax=Chamaesiphon sp. OTE_75_metabat_556 TaxID=2964692 RepID=UPI00286C44AA|nr:hypothetical protein [Chamaesiphon sp. OTE_75_metabat_556]